MHTLDNPNYVENFFEMKVGIYLHLFPHLQKCL